MSMWTWLSLAYLAAWCVFGGTLAYYWLRYDRPGREWPVVTPEQNAETVRRIEAYARVWPTWIGIAGDGVTDDTDGLQRWLDGDNVRHVVNVKVRITRPLRIWRPHSTVASCVFLHPAGMEPLVIERSARPHYVWGNLAYGDDGKCRVLRESIPLRIRLSPHYICFRLHMRWLNLLLPARVWLLTNGSPWRRRR
jgi:hypothetical protein